MLRRGQAHLAAAALPRHFDFPGGSRGDRRTPRPSTRSSGGGGPKPKSWKDIAGKRIGVIDETGATTCSPRRRCPRRPSCPPDTNTAQLLDQVAHGELDYALVESNRYTLARRYFPQLEVAFNVGKPVEYACPVAARKRSRSSPPPCRSSSGPAATAP